MNLEKVIFGFFIILAMTLNFSFVYGEIEDPAHHNFIEFFLVVVVNIIATTLKLGDRTQIGAVLLATSLVANLQLITAAAIWTNAVHISGTGLQAESLALIVSHAAGALIANIVSVTVFVAETLMLRR
jgi:Ca2+/H+ antiporter, TMEM165/GDT1 family